MCSRNAGSGLSGNPRTSPPQDAVNSAISHAAGGLRDLILAQLIIYRMGAAWARLLAVRYPNVLYLCRVVEEPAPFALIDAKPVNSPPFVGEDLLQVANGERFHHCAAGLVPKAPDGVNVVVFHEHLHQLGRPA